MSESIELTLPQLQQVIYQLLEILTQRALTEELSRAELEELSTVVEGIIFRAKVCSTQLNQTIDYLHLMESFAAMKELPYVNEQDLQ